jgi:hypothetical protein
MFNFSRVLERSRQKLELATANALAVRIKRRVLVIESDDWGSIRLVDRNSRENLEQAGIELKTSPFNTLDCLETKDDLERLLTVLKRHRNSEGRHPVMTLNTVLCNPHFERIEATDFQEYHCESLFESYERYYKQDLSGMWQEGINNQVIYPQFHAREHLNVSLWMRDLQTGRIPVRTAFNHRFFGLRTQTSSANQRHYVAAYSPDSLEELNTLCRIATDGLSRFERTFGFRSNTFIGCNYVWPVEIEKVLFEAGITHLQTRLKRFSPDPNKGGQRRVLRHHTGQRNENGQTFGVRNVLFEPYLDRKKNWVASALKEINSAFFWGVPAIVCSHRINYCSHIDTALPSLTLPLLDNLIKEVVRRWPDVSFLSSSQLAEILSGKSSAGGGI